MSNYLAIAAVTATLQSVLQGNVGQDIAGINVTTERPDSLVGDVSASGVNIYLYQVTPNTAWRNEDLPTRASDGRLVQRPRVALDLHYLLTFYGDESQLMSQQVLGSVVRTLHANPLLTRNQIVAVTEAPGHFLSNSNLHEDVESVKFMPLSLSLEELSKLWSVFFQTAYTLSMAYLATTVLIEADLTSQRALPVQRPIITVIPFQQARIEAVVSATGEDEPIVVGGTLLVKGEGLGGAVRAIRVGEAELTPTRVGNMEISVELTDDTLRAGIQGVQILYEDSSESNVMPLVLRPVINSPIDPVVAPGILAIELTSTVGVRQRVMAYLNEVLPPMATSPRAYSLSGIEHENETDIVTFEIDDNVVAPGTYLVQVQVGGAESILDQDIDGNYSGPTVTIQ